MGNLGALFQSKVILIVLAVVVLAIVVFAGFFILRWIRGGFGRFTKSNARYQSCVFITANNKLAFRNLEVLGNCVVDWASRLWYTLDPAALIPYLKTGEPHLPLDERDAIPFYPLRPDRVREEKEAWLQTNIKSIAEEENRDARMKAQQDTFRADQIAQRNFVLLASFGIFALVVLVIMITHFVGK